MPARKWQNSKVSTKKSCIDTTALDKRQKKSIMEVLCEEFHYAYTFQSSKV